MKILALRVLWVQSRIPLESALMKKPVSGHSEIEPVGASASHILIEAS